MGCVMSNNLTPMDVVTRLIGPLKTVAAICDVSEKAPFLWMRGAKWRSPGDLPSARYQRALLRYSDARGLGLRAEHLICGATEDEIQSILSARVAPTSDHAASVAAEPA